jgi:hypothetical protein
MLKLLLVIFWVAMLYLMYCDRKQLREKWEEQEAREAARQAKLKELYPQSSCEERMGVKYGGRSDFHK